MSLTTQAGGHALSNFSISMATDQRLTLLVKLYIQILPVLHMSDAGAGVLCSVLACKSCSYNAAHPVWTDLPFSISMNPTPTCAGEKQVH